MGNTTTDVQPIYQETNRVSIYPISQATTATFTDLYFRLTFLFFVQRGSKHIVTPSEGKIVGEKGDLVIFSPGALVTMENRPVLNKSYRALGVCFSNDLIDTVFAQSPSPKQGKNIQIVDRKTHRPDTLLSLVQNTIDNERLPTFIRQHRLLEPLIWLREHGIYLPTRLEEQPIGRIRRLIETDLSRAWTAGDVAESFSMSEATLRRRLAKSGSSQGFAKILLHTRLEHGLTLLQTTDAPISNIALTVGFKTPSHFSDAFRRRFGIAPKAIRLSSD